jgi:hypothetical protein
MSLNPSDNMVIPADTVRVARGIYPRGDNLWIKMRDELWKGSFRKLLSPWVSVGRVIVAQPESIFSI